jgi:hypothetical protein
MIEMIEDHDGEELSYANLYEGATLEQAGHIWYNIIKSDGGHCPVCDRWGKLYRRGISANMARQLVWLCQQTPREDGWVDVQNTAPKWLLRAPQIGTLRHWNMVTDAPVAETKSKSKRKSKARSAGLWKPTAIGLEFVHNRISVPKYKYVYNDTVFDTEGPDVTILDCIGEHFNYSELMNANYYGEYTGNESEDGSEENA